MLSTWYSYGDFKDLTRRTASDKILRSKAFNIAKNPAYDGCHRGLASMVYKSFDKKNFWQWYWKWEYVRPAISRRITQTNY